MSAGREKENGLSSPLLGKDHGLENPCFVKSDPKKPRSFSAMTETHLGMLPDDWPLRRIDELFETQLGKMLSEKARGGDEPQLYLRNKNVQWGRIEIEDVLRMDFDEREKIKFRLVPGDLLICEGGVVGRAALWKGEIAEYYFQKALHRLRPLDGAMTNEFMLYWMRFAFEIQNFYGISGASSTIAHLPAAQLRALEVPLPPLPEQKKIAQILSTVQRAIEAQERIIQTTTELKKALMHKLFTEGLRHEPQKQTEIGPVPESWEVRKLGGIAKTISKGSSPKWQGFQYTESGILFVRSQNVGSGKMLLEDRAYLPASFNEKEKRSILKSGDILINLVGASIGRVALGTDEIEGGNCNQAVGFVRLKGSESLKQLIVYFLLSPWGQEQMRRQKKDIARANLSLLDVRGFQIPIPSTDEEIEEAARALVTLEEKVATHERKRAQLQDLFRTLLHELMTGTKRVNK